MFHVKFVDLLTTYQMPFAVCRFDVSFLIYEGGGERAQHQGKDLCILLMIKFRYQVLFFKFYFVSFVLLLFNIVKYVNILLY